MGICCGRKGSSSPKGQHGTSPSPNPTSSLGVALEPPVEECQVDIFVENSSPKHLDRVEMQLLGETLNTNSVAAPNRTTRKSATTNANQRLEQAHGGIQVDSDEDRIPAGSPRLHSRKGKPLNPTHSR